MKPMLAKEFTGKVVLPCFVQPKLDGVRCIVTCDEDYNPIAMSRNEKPIDLPDNIYNVLHGLFFRNKATNLILDGELYHHGSSFQDVLSMVKRVKNGRHPDVDKISYNVYDLVQDAPFYHRLTNLQLLDEFDFDNLYVKMVETRSVNYLSELNSAHETYVGQGYEGSMIRDYNTAYEEGKRSHSLYKRKDWLEEDFKLVGISEGQGKNAGTGVLLLETDKGVRFSATSPGDYTSKAHWWKNREEILSTKPKVSVKFQNYTDDGAPRFPEALGIKEDR